MLREGSFSRAAAALSLSQPSVSQQVAALERQIGAPLLERRPTGITATAAGAILAAHADVIHERMMLAERQLAEALGSERAPLRIGAVPSALAGFVPEATNALRRLNDQAEIRIQEGDSTDLPGRLLDGDHHLVVTFQDAEQPRRDHPDLERTDLLRESFVAALPPDHPLADQQQLALAALAGDAWSASSHDGLIVRACRQAGFEPRVGTVTRDQFAIRAAILGAGAVTLVGAGLADAFLDTALIPLKAGAPLRDVYALMPPGGRHPLTDPLLDALKAAAARRTTIAGVIAT